jgi:hypothetical protein
MSRVMHGNLPCKDTAHVMTRLSKNMSGVTYTICKECMYVLPPPQEEVLASPQAEVAGGSPNSGYPRV